jgi:thiamine biosynthesis lipoprotein
MQTLNHNSILSFAHNAMATTFTIRIAHSEADYAAKAAKAAFIEIDRLEQLLSRFIEGSDIWRINHTPLHTPVLLAQETYECLNLAADILNITDGTFDFTIGILADAWKNNQTPPPDFITNTLNSTGSDFIRISPDNLSATRISDLINIDLGAIGKGFAIDKAAELLEDWDIPCAMLDSGGSSILALEPPPDVNGWEVSCGNNTFLLTQGAVSASGFAEQPNHIIDPQTGTPPEQQQRAWAMAPTAAIADALSTAATLMNPDRISDFNSRHPELKLFSEQL